MKWIGRADPLFLFLAAGLALYLLLDALGLTRSNERLIAVDAVTLNTYLSSEGGRLPGRSVEAMSQEERQSLIDRYVSEEALYREARALGLDRGDTAIRRRLVQSLRFSLQGEAEAKADEPSDAQLRSFLDSHRERYVEGAKVSFSHVYFDSKRRGKQQAFEVARKALPAVGRNDWLAMGDRYPYQRSQIEVTEDALSSELGQAAARRILALAPGENWQGPIESELGFHLVRVDRKTSGSEPDFDAIRGDLAAGLAEERREQALQRVIDGIVAGYRVRLSPDLEGTAQ